MKKLALPLLLVLLLLVTAGAAYGYDSSNGDLIASGTRVAGVDVGGMRYAEARALIAEEVASPLERPVRVRAAGQTFRLSPRRARVRADVDGMARAALASSRSGNFLGRAWREATGASTDADLPAEVSYSRRAVSRLVDRVERGVNRPARDATVSFANGGLTRVRARTGRELRTAALERAVRRRIARPGSRTVRAGVRTLQPKVLTRDLEKRYPHYVVVNRGSYRLSYYRRLKLVKTYPIAVGKAGLETPAGKYQIQNKAENPAWHVPNSDWAGDLAGKIIPGGRSDNPLKARWMGIYDGAGIHGTSETGSLGTNASHGCIRMSIPEVIELYSKVPVQTPVYIV